MSLNIHLSYYYINEGLCKIRLSMLSMLFWHDVKSSKIVVQNACKWPFKKSRSYFDCRLFSLLHLSDWWRPITCDQK